MLGKMTVSLFDRTITLLIEKIRKIVYTSVIRQAYLPKNIRSTTPLEIQRCKKWKRRPRYVCVLIPCKKAQGYHFLQSG